MHLPFFIEASTCSDSGGHHICRKVMAALFKRNVSPLPFATTFRDAAQVSASLKARHLAPAIFVIDTYLAETLLSELRTLIGATPALLLRREVHPNYLPRKKDLVDTTVILKKLDGTQKMLCPYNPCNAALVADQVTECLLAFLNDGDFWHFARLNMLAISATITDL